MEVRVASHSSLQILFTNRKFDFVCTLVMAARPFSYTFEKMSPSPSESTVTRGGEGEGRALGTIVTAVSHADVNIDWGIQREEMFTGSLSHHEKFPPQVAEPNLSRLE